MNLLSMLFDDDEYDDDGFWLGLSGSSNQSSSHPDDSTFDPFIDDTSVSGNNTPVACQDDTDVSVNQQSSGDDDSSHGPLTLPKIGDEFSETPQGFHLIDRQDPEFAGAFGGFDKQFAPDALGFYPLTQSIAGLTTGHTDIPSVFVPDMNSLRAGVAGAAVGGLVGFVAGGMVGGIPGAIAGADSLLEPGFVFGFQVGEALDDLLTRSSSVMGIENAIDSEDASHTPTGFPSPSPNMANDDRQQLNTLK
ncbi:MAG TPA: hypothetical protein VM554_05675 [Acidisarcina sp.]|nr:hypothetical protein [Acidisarcina sp.]